MHTPLEPQHAWIVIEQTDTDEPLRVHGFELIRDARLFVEDKATSFAIDNWDWPIGEGENPSEKALNGLLEAMRWHDMFFTVRRLTEEIRAGLGDASKAYLLERLFRKTWRNSTHKSTTFTGPSPRTRRPFVATNP